MSSKKPSLPLFVRRITSDGAEQKATTADIRALTAWKNGKQLKGDARRVAPPVEGEPKLPRDVAEEKGVDVRFLTPLDTITLVGGGIKGRRLVEVSSTHVVPPLLKSFFSLPSITEVIQLHFDQVLNPTERQQMGDILSGSDEIDFAALGQFLLHIVQASVADAGDLVLRISRALGRCMARAMTRDTVLALFLLVLLLVPVILLRGTRAPDAPDDLDPVEPENADTAFQAAVGLVGSGFKIAGRASGRLLGYNAPTDGSLDTGGEDTGDEPPTGPIFGFGFISADKTESEGYFETKLAAHPRIVSLGNAARPFVIAPGKDNATDGIQAVYEAMTAAFIEQDDSLKDEATFFGHLLAWTCTKEITPGNLQALNVAGRSIVKKKTDEDLNQFLQLVTRPPVESVKFSPTSTKKLDSSEMEDVVAIFNATGEDLSGTALANVLGRRADLIGGVHDPLRSVFGPSPMLSLGAV